MILTSWLPCYNNIVVAKPRRLLFCPIPKVACSNWKMTLRQAAGFDDYADDVLAHDRENNGLRYLRKYNRFARLYFVNNSKYTTVVFVRNPWTRILSAYRSKVENVLTKRNFDPNNSKHRFRFEIAMEAKSYCVSRNLVEDDHSEDLTFGEFLHYIKANSTGKLNEHWAPQWRIAGLDRIRYDFIGTFENLERDAETLCKMAGLPEFYRGRIPSVPVTQSSEPEVIRQYYDVDRVNLVSEIYRRDIDLLGYQSPNILS